MNIPLLGEALRQQLSAEQLQWLDAAIDDIKSNAGSQDAQLLYSAMTSRKLTSKPMLPPQWPFNIDEAARILLLQTYIDISGDSRYDTIWQAYRLGDENEKAAYIKGLSIIDPDGKLLDIALHTGRTNNISLFSAIALRNPYPARYYDDREFEQLVFKALFLGLNIIYIDSLQQRLHPDLSVKCMDLVRERLAAERRPPVSIWMAIDIRHLDESSQHLYLTFLNDADKDHRYYSLLALKQLGLSEQYRSQLQQRQEIETDNMILQLLA